MSDITIAITPEQANSIYRELLVVTEDGAGDFPVAYGDWREYYRLDREDTPSNFQALRRATRARLGDDYVERVQREINETTSLLEQLEAQRDASSVSLTAPREQLLQIAESMANVASEDDRRGIRAGLDLLDLLEGGS